MQVINSASGSPSPAVSTGGPLIGRSAPRFELECVQSAQDEPSLATNESAQGGWTMLIFYPRDFSFVCPTELTAFSGRCDEFANRNCRLLGISVDTLDLHREWLTTPPATGGLGPLRFPLASDPQGAAAQAFGVWDDEHQVSLRGLFLIDPAGVLQYSVVHNLSVGRSTEEVLRVIDALQSGGLCPVSWTRADGTLDAESALQPGRVLGHYRIRGNLGQGTFGHVFAAWDLRLERNVAIKILKQPHGTSREALLHEARAAARLQHPGICTVYAVEEIDGLPVIVMELIEGPLLSEIISTPLPRSTAFQLASETAAAVAAAHSEGIVHGDLKPANIMLTRDGHPKILDFGLASRRFIPATDVSSEESPEATAVMSIAVPNGKVTVSGTPAYMSPEQALGEFATSASDVYAFGLMLYELLTGRRAMGDSNPVEVLMRLRRPQLAEDLALDVDPECRPLLLAILDPQPALRPTMAEIARWLAQDFTAANPG